MSYKTFATHVINAIEERIKRNLAVGNTRPIVITLTFEEIKDRMQLERLKGATRDRIVEKFEEEGYDVTVTRDSLVIEVNHAERTTLFQSLDDLEESLLLDQE